MIDETDPVVRAIQAPFEARMGQFYRQIKDANADYHDEMDKLDKEIAEREEKLRQQREGENPEAAEPEKPADAKPEWDYDSPLASTAPPAPSLPSPQHAPAAAAESNWDYGDPLADSQDQPRHSSWEQSAAEPEPTVWPSPAPVAPSAPPTPRRTRSLSRNDSDDDYSSESWMQ